ncbi:PRC-barrel domain-containing protein [Methanopyrus sp. KOL6]|uniref:PRC-barrel domain-containing protein n=1 Tax=Methanopyrus sp. KOL6 TaxID=1937004 RepID=UPI0012FB252C|nr:PRC-barrel domain-containing protein [Methanopyrus sp. KOL6]
MTNGESGNEEEYKKRYVRFQRILGMEVFTEDGRRVGTVEDVTFDPKTGDLVRFLVTVTNQPSGGGLLPLPGGGGRRTETVDAELVKAVGDIIIIESTEKASSGEGRERKKQESSPAKPSDLEI